MHENVHDVEGNFLFIYVFKKISFLIHRGRWVHASSLNCLSPLLINKCAPILTNQYRGGHVHCRGGKIVG